MKNLTPDRAAVVRLLRDIIDEEIDKPDGQTDMALVEECSAFMGELLDEQFPMTDGEIEARLDSLKKKAAKEKKIVRKIPRIIGKIAVCAAVMFIVGIGIYANYPAVQSWIVSMSGTPASPTNVTGSITHMSIGESLIYTDIETLIDKEGLEGILYPKTLPEDLEVSYVIYHGKETDYSRINYNFTDSSVNFSIGLNCVGYVEPEEGDCIEPAGELTFVIKTLDNIYAEDSDEVLYHASAADEEGRYYIIESTSLEKVMGLINQFKPDDEPHKNL